jgi:signal peptidase I
MSKNFKESQLYKSRFEIEERRSSFQFLIFLFVCIFAVFGFRIYWTDNFGGVQVDGASMNNTLYHGEELLMRYYDEGDALNRGDVIVVYAADYPEVIAYNKGKPASRQITYLIKRLIAIEGDKVKCVDGQIYICYAGTDEFVPLDEPYAHYTNRSAYDFGEYTVGKDEIFFLGDNRNNSCDSRYQQSGGSHLSGRLYKEKDVYGIVPEWAIKNQAVLQKIFF